MGFSRGMMCTSLMAVWATAALVAKTKTPNKITWKETALTLGDMAPSQLSIDDEVAVISSSRRHCGCRTNRGMGQEKITQETNGSNRHAPGSGDHSGS